MKLKIELYSFWSTGTGKAGGSLDAVVLKDKDNLPYIPGRTLKGLLREAYQECNLENENVLFGHQKAKKDNNISKENLITGNLRFNTARVVANREEIAKYSNQLYHTKTAISLDKNGQAEDKSLRKTEMTIPLMLEVDLYYKELNDTNNETDVPDLTNTCKMLRLLGEKRHRGLGRCKIEIEEENKNLNPPSNTKDNIVDLKDIKSETNELVFKCVLNEPLILIQKDKTEHNIESLEYIPGSVFRGILAGGLFNKKPEFIDDIIFNNSVQFEDAHLVINTERSLRLPFSYYIQKKKANKFLNFHKNIDWSEKTKQQKKGYFVEESQGIKYADIQYGSVIKSSRSKEHRASEKSGLFTYHYLEAGQEFIFSVKSKNQEYLKIIYNTLTSEQHYIGKSALAEFGGCIAISCIKAKINEVETHPDISLIYAESNLCFINELGEFTGTPTGQQLTGIEGTKINWLKSQVKTRRFAPYNGFRKNWDSERLIMEKGSVFVLEKPIQMSNSKRGLFQSEGYGNLLLNPTFLSAPEVKYFYVPNKKSIVIETEKVFINEEEDTVFVKYLKENHNEQFVRKEIKAKAAKYSISKFKQQNSSQWARVFDATTRATDTEKLKTLLLNAERGKTNCSVLNGGTHSWDKKDVEIFEEIIEKEHGFELIRRISKNNIKYS